MRFILLILLTSCLRPHYEPQYIDIPLSWRLQPNEGDTLCNAGWWEQFHDPVLSELIGVALANNQDLKVAASRVMAYYDRLIVTNSALYPAVSANGSYMRAETSLAQPLIPPRGIGRLTNDFQASLNLSWELDLWGRLASASEAAFSDLLGQVEARRGVIVTLVTEVANSYITLRQLDWQLDIARKTMESRLESLRLAQCRFDLGETSEMEVFQAESEVEVAAIQMLRYERDIPQQENRLSVLLGLTPQPIKRGATLDTFLYPPEIPVGLPSDLLTRRPDIMRAEEALIAANARVTQARALFFPQIALTGIYGSESDTLHRFLTSPAELWQYGLSAVQTIFDAGRITYLVEEARARRDEALFTYRQTILRAFQEVEDALIAVEKNRQLVHENSRQVKVLNDYFQMATLRYAEGEIDYLNVLDAERSLFNAELDLAAASALSFNAIVDLYAALGGGWVLELDLKLPIVYNDTPR